MEKKIMKKLKNFSRLNRKDVKGIVSMKKEEYGKWKELMGRIIEG